MKVLHILIALLLVALTSCLKIEEEPIMTIRPVAEITAHVKNEQVFATAQVSVNPQILAAGNLPLYYEYSGEVAIYNTVTGTIIDVNAFSGGGLSQFYTVSADTLDHVRFIVIAEGSIDAITDIGNDDDSSNDKIVATGEFHNEATIIIADLNPIAEE